MVDRQIIERVAGALATNEGVIEKDWQVVRTLGVLAALEYPDAIPVFSGGTSLSKGWGLIKRFSEDIDFKVAMAQAASGAEGRKRRRTFRELVLEALTANDFDLADDPLIGNQSQFFAASLAYKSHFPAGRGLRPHIRIEMSFHNPALPPINRSLQSLIAQAQKQLPEVSSFPCINPVETAADKLSALAWRVCTRQRGSENDDPAVIRHLYDLAALEGHIAQAPEFSDLVHQIMAKDAGRGGMTTSLDSAARFSTMLDCLSNDKLWASEYETYVLQVSFAGPEERISFSQAVEAARHLIATVCKE